MKQKLIIIEPKKIIFLYNLVNEMFMLLNTQIESVKHYHVKKKYTINKIIKKIHNLNIIA